MWGHISCCSAKFDLQGVFALGLSLLLSLKKASDYLLRWSNICWQDGEQCCVVEFVSMKMAEKKDNWRFLPLFRVQLQGPVGNTEDLRLREHIANCVI